MPDQKPSSASACPIVADAAPPPPQQEKRSPFLRRCSISDPRLDILPQLNTLDKGFNPFNRVLSGLFERKVGASAESVNQDQHPTSDTHQPKQSLSEQRKSTTNLDASSPTFAAPPLRKSSTSMAALSGTSPAHLFQQQPHFSTILETAEDQGLVMSARPALQKSSANSSNFDDNTNARNVREKSGQPLAAAASGADGGGTPQKWNGGGGFMRMFGGGGFLSKPLMHTEEENYRYIMALDR